MVNAYVRLPSFTVEMPNISEIGRPLYSHLKFSGKSPVVTRHCTLVDSPELDGSSPKSNGAIFGKTVCHIKGNKQISVANQLTKEKFATSRVAWALSDIFNLGIFQ